MANELYGALEITQEATEEEIKRAYYRLVRRYPPEKEPEKFKSIRGAYETLSDAKARRSYDAMQEHGEEITNLLEEAEKHREANNYVKAVRCLKKILVLHPEADAARNTLGLTFLDAGRLDEGIELYRGLTSRVSDTAVYWHNYGHAHKSKAESESKLTCADVERHRLLAQQCFEKAIGLEPYNSAPYMALAEMNWKAGSIPTAIHWAEKAIGADGKTDFQDFEALFFIAIMRFAQGDLLGVEQQGQRIKDLTPEDEDVKKYVAFRFGQLGAVLAENKNFVPAATFLKTARSFDCPSEEFSRVVDSVEILAEAIKSHDRFSQDPEIIPPLRFIGTIILSAEVGEEVQNREALFRSFLHELNSYGATNVLRSIACIRTRYPSIYKLREDLFQNIDQAARRITEQQTSSTSPVYSLGGSSTTPSRGECFIATAAFGSPDELVIDFYRAFRDRGLRTALPGQWLITLYGHLGPPCARFIEPRPWLRWIVRKVLVLLAPLARFLTPRQ